MDLISFLKNTFVIIEKYPDTLCPVKNEIKISLVSAFRAFLAIMVTMTKIAVAANSIIVDPGTVRIGGNETGTQTITLTTDNPGTIKSLSIGGDGFTLTDNFIVIIDGVETTSVSSSSGWQSPKVSTVTFTNKGAPKGNYVINFNATFNSGGLTKKALIETDVKAKPEFSTVALPVASVLGIIFIMQRKRNEAWK